MTASAAIAACSSKSSSTPATPDEDAGSSSGIGDPVDVPIDGLSHDTVVAHQKGDAIFDTPFREPDGLGPLYIRDHCGACHDTGGRGPGLVQTMVLVEADGVTPRTDQSLLAFGHTERPLLAAGAITPLLPPPDAGAVNVRIRVGPPILGRGYMEAVMDSEIERMEAEQAKRTDGIHGKINRVQYLSTQSGDPAYNTYKLGDANLIGRFGLKAKVPSLDDFTAAALQGDMGITSPMRPDELPNPDALNDDRKPGLDTTVESINAITTYVRTLAIPRRTVSADDAGKALFDQVKCSVCHVPSLKTRPDYPVAPLANIDAPVFTDFLLHDLGYGVSDGMTDQSAGPTQWRTAPLIGLRFNKTFLHDGRARNITEAITLHAGPGSESDESAQLFSKLSQADRDALVAYVSAL